jgi:hypothetical protein
MPHGVYPMNFHAETISVSASAGHFSFFKPVFSGQAGRRAGCFYLHASAVGLDSAALIAVSVEWSPWARSYLVTEHHPVTHEDERYTFIRGFREAVRFGRYRAEQRGALVKRGVLALDGIVSDGKRRPSYFRPAKRKMAASH